MKKLDKKTFAPWVVFYQVGAVLCIAGISGFFIATDLSQKGMCVGLLVLGIAFIQRGFIRARGKLVESRAVRSLSLPSGWKFEANVLLPGLGDIDLLITDPKECKFAVEIKSYNGVKKRWFSDKLVKLNGSKLDRDPVAQVRLCARRIGGTPIIWLPNASGPRIKLSDGTLVVQGAERQLRRAIGASSWFF